MTTLAIGRVTRPHGVRGELRVQLFWPESDALSRARAVELGVAGPARKHLEVQHARRAGKAWLVKLAGIDDRDAAQALAGAELAVDRDVLGELDEGEYFLADLLGAHVVAPGGEIGEVIEIRSHPSVDCLVIRKPDGTLVEQPLAEPWIASVDVKARRVTLSSADGIIA